jgi:hypothetical protein
MLVGTTATNPAGRLHAAADMPPADLAPVVSAAAGRITPALTGGQIFTDDRAPVEWLVDLSLAEQAR